MIKYEKQRRFIKDMNEVICHVGKNTPGRENSKCKCPEMEIFLTWWVNSKVASAAEQSRASRVTGVGGDVLERVWESK